MKRDMDLIRSILLKVEESKRPWCEGIMEVAGYELGAVTYHLRLLIQAGYITALELPDSNTEYGYLLQDAQMTWLGHEFLEQVRDPEIWRRTKDGAEKVGSWSFSFLGSLAKGLAKQKAADLGFPIA